MTGRSAGVVGALVMAFAMRASAQHAPVEARVRAQIDLDLEHEVRVPGSGSYTPGALPPPQFYHDSVRVIRERSRVVSGMTYSWGVYGLQPLGESILTTVAGDARDRIVTLATPADWWRLASVLAWEPENDEKAIAACGEIIVYVGPHRSNFGRAAIYEDARSLKRFGGEVREALKAKGIRKPVVTREEGGSRYRVELWTVQSVRVTKYVCEIGHSTPTLVETLSFAPMM